MGPSTWVANAVCTRYRDLLEVPFPPVMGSEAVFVVAEVRRATPLHLAGACSVLCVQPCPLPLAPTSVPAPCVCRSLSQEQLWQSWRHEVLQKGTLCTAGDNNPGSRDILNPAGFITNSLLPSSGEATPAKSFRFPSVLCLSG